VYRVAFTVVQLTDLHLGAPWCAAGPALARVVPAVLRTLHGPPDAVIVTGDVANDGTDEQYAEARELLDRLDAPLYVVPGNHDDRTALRRHFTTPVSADGRLIYTVPLGPLRLVALDTKRPDSDAGQLDGAQLAWLEAELAKGTATPTLVAMHHPPIEIGMAPMDRIGIAAEERAAFVDVLAHHPQVQTVVAGHVHRLVVGSLGSASVMAVPSTCEQLVLDFAAGEMRFVPEPPSFAVHLVLDGRIVSHVQPVEPVH
jgi:3',5'-cyclic-AMP phosphodiesterase